MVDAQSVSDCMAENDARQQLETIWQSNGRSRTSTESVPFLMDGSDKAALDLKP